MKFETKNKPLTIFTFASLTDIVLLLLVFFLLTSAFVNYSGIKVKLPEAGVKEKLPEKNIFITITKDNRIYLNSTLIKPQKLKSELEKLAKENPESVVIIRAERSVTIQSVINVMDVARASGFKKFIVATQFKRKK